MIVGILLVIVTFFGQPAKVYAEASASPAECEARAIEINAKVAKLPGFKAVSHACFATQVAGDKVSS